MQRLGEKWWPWLIFVGIQTVLLALVHLYPRLSRFEDPVTLTVYPWPESIPWITVAVIATGFWAAYRLRQDYQPWKSRLIFWTTTGLLFLISPFFIFGVPHYEGLETVRGNDGEEYQLLIEHAFRDPDYYIARVQSRGLLSTTYQLLGGGTDGESYGYLTLNAPPHTVPAKRFYLAQDRFLVVCDAGSFHAIGAYDLASKRFFGPEGIKQLSPKLLSGP